MNTIYTQFQQALKREKQHITTYYDNIQYPCLYRKVDDYKNTSNHIEIFYDIATPIKQGQLLIRGGKAFIVINKESVENDTYYKSTIKECNLEIPVVINSVTSQIPCYSYDLNSAYAVGNNVLTLADGKGELITELIPELSTTAYIDKGFRIMGGYYKVANMYNLDGIVHLMIERDTMPADTYSLNLSSDVTSFVEGDTTQLIAMAMVNDIQDTTATITYSSDNETVATVDSNGLVTLIGVGSVVITATWVERTLTKTLGLSVIADPSVENYTIDVYTSSDLTIGSSIARTFIPTLKDNTGTEVPFPATPVWTFNYNGMPPSDFTITYDGNNCKIKIKENYDLLGQILRVICTTADGKWTGYKDNMIVM